MSQSSEQIQHSALRCNIALASDPATLQTAVQILASGGLVAIPTETVYGLGAAINNEISVAKIFAVKGRPQDHPLIVHIADIKQLNDIAIDIPFDAIKLAQACWPGPLTILLKRNSHISADITGGRETVAVRVPDNAFTRQLITALGSPIAAPSANRFGKVSPTTAQHVCDDLQTDVDLIVDDGNCSIGVESTIIDFTASHPQLLRPGGFPVEDIESIIGGKVHEPSGDARASGMLASHYSPDCRVVLVQDMDEALALHTSTPHSRILEHSGNYPLYAASLYAQMRQADIDKMAVIIAVLPLNSGLGSAIRDRLTKASFL